MTTEDLACATRWAHRLGSTVTAEVTLADGRTISSSALRGVLNRLVHPAWPQLGQARTEDREYAAQEMMALYMSWLRCLSAPVLNPPTPQGLSGYWRHDSQWAVLAAEAGLRTPTYRMGSGQPEGGWSIPHGDPDADTDDAGDAADERGVRLVVVGEAVVGDVTQPDVVHACRRLARLSATPLLGVDLVEEGGAWTFVHATPQPELRAWGDAFLAALVQALRQPQAALR